MKKKKKEWFAEWFDSPYYHILYQNRDDSEAQAFIERLLLELQLPKAAKVLDLACGKGRHSVQLSKQDLQVTGVDLSPQSIAHAKQFEAENLHFDVHDMREIYKKETFDAVLNLFTSFGYFKQKSDNQRVVDSIAEMLLPNGLLLIDFMNAEKVIANLVEKETKRVDGILFHISRSLEKGKIVKRIQFGDAGRMHNFREEVQALKLVDFEQFLQEKFTIEAVKGDYEWNDFEPETSKRLILLARKK